MRIYTYITLAAILALSITLSTPVNSQAFSLFGDGYEKVIAKDGIVSIPVNDVNDGDIHYYKYPDGNREIRFFLLKSSDGVIRAAFDACDVCFASRKGYSRSGDSVVCNNCGMRFHSSRINVVKGGCNPAPLTRESDGDTVRIQTVDILQGARFF